MRSVRNGSEWAHGYTRSMNSLFSSLDTDKRGGEWCYWRNQCSWLWLRNRNCWARESWDLCSLGAGLHVGNAFLQLHCFLPLHVGWLGIPIFCITNHPKTQWLSCRTMITFILIMNLFIGQSFVGTASLWSTWLQLEWLEGWGLESSEALLTYMYSGWCWQSAGVRLEYLAVAFSM